MAVTAALAEWGVINRAAAACCVPEQPPGVQQLPALQTTGKTVENNLKNADTYLHDVLGANTALTDPLMTDQAHQEQAADGQLRCAASLNS
jgi:hypothetical protein